MSFPIFPVDASTYGAEVDRIFLVLTVLTVFFTTLVLGLMVFFAIRYRRGSRASRVNPSYGDLRLELAWSLGPMFLALLVFAWSSRPYSYVYRPPADAMEIFVIGKQWMWHIQHANGIREMNQLHIPEDRAIKLTMISQDVIHGFYIPAFRTKRDVLPGRYNTVWFEATRTGKFHLFCSEYCGTNHSEMGGWVYVMKPADFDQWEENSNTLEAAEHQTMTQMGSDLFQNLGCESCHSTSATARGPSLNGLYGSTAALANGGTATVDDNFIRSAIINPHGQQIAGFPDIMEAYPVGTAPGDLSEEQVLSLVAYIKSLGASPASSSAGGASAAGRKP